MPSPSKTSFLTSAFERLGVPMSTGNGDEVAKSETPIGDELETARSFKVDVDRALERETQDGKGDEDPGPSDFVSFATEGVEKEEDA